MTAVQLGYRAAVDRFNEIDGAIKRETAALATLREAYTLAHRKPRQFDADYVTGVRADMTATEERISRLRTELKELEVALLALQNSTVEVKA
jgi:hypothetical protein